MTTNKKLERIFELERIFDRLNDLISDFETLRERLAALEKAESDRQAHEVTK